MSVHIKPIGWIRRQDGLEYAPVMVLYAMKPAPDNKAKPVEMYSRDQVEHMLAEIAALRKIIASTATGRVVQS